MSTTRRVFVAYWAGMLTSRVDAGASGTWRVTVVYSAGTSTVRVLAGVLRARFVTVLNCAGTSTRQTMSSSPSAKVPIASFAPLAPFAPWTPFAPENCLPCTVEAVALPELIAEICEADRFFMLDTSLACDK